MTMKQNAECGRFKYLSLKVDGNCLAFGVVVTISLRPLLNIFKA